MHFTRVRPNSDASNDRRPTWWRRPVLRLAGVAVAATGLIVGPNTLSTPVEAAPSPVTIRTIPAKVVSPGAAAVVRPSFKKRSGVAVRKASIDVRRSTSWVGKGMKTARLTAGTYRVTTKVTYRERGKTRLRTAKRTQSVRISSASVPSQAARPAPKPTPTPAPATSLAIQGAPCDSTSLRKPDGSTWTCSFSDEFGGTRLDRSRWKPLTTSATGYQIGAECFVDDPANISVAGGALSLSVRKLDEEMSCAGAREGDEKLDHTAGSVMMNDAFAQSRGRFEIRAAFPATTVAGHHSALWMFPSTFSEAWPLSGEIDIAEYFSRWHGRAIPYVHYGYWDTSVTNNYCFIADPSAFNTYTLEWTATTMSIAYNGQTCLTHQIADEHKKPFEGTFKLLLTQGLGIGEGPDGNLPTSATPDVGTMKVDYVRIWK